MIKNIIFDLGGVLYDIDFKASFTAFKKIGVNNIEELFSQFHAAPVFEQIETGAITLGEFYEALRKIIGKNISDNDLQDAYNAMLLQFRSESLAHLLTLKNKYRLYLLSNTNQIHYNYFSAQLKKETPYPSLESFFQKAWFSHQIHLRKPHKEVYEFVLQDGGLKAEETLFIDDTYTNLPEAEKLSIQTHLLLPEQRIETLLK